MDTNSNQHQDENELTRTAMVVHRDYFSLDEAAVVKESPLMQSDSQSNRSDNSCGVRQ